MKLLLTLISVTALGASVALASDSTDPITTAAVVPAAYAPVKSRQHPPLPLNEALTQARAELSTVRSVERANFVAPPSDSSRKGAWLNLQISVAGLKNGLDIEPMWHGDLFEGSVAESIGSSENLHDDLAGATFDAVLPNGELVEGQDGGMGDVQRGQVFENLDAEAVRADLRHKISELGLKEVDLDVFQVPTPAPSVVVSISSVDAAFENLPKILATLFYSGRSRRFVGYYFELRVGPFPILRKSLELRTSASRLWARLDLAGRAGAANTALPS